MIWTLHFFCLPTKGDLQSSVQKGSNAAACSHTSGAKGERLWEFPASFPCLLLFLFPQEITVWENSPPAPPVGKKDREDILDILCREKGLNVWIWGSPCYTNCNLIVFTRTHVCWEKEPWTRKKRGQTTFFCPIFFFLPPRFWTIVMSCLSTLLTPERENIGFIVKLVCKAEGLGAISVCFPK